MSHPLDDCRARLQRGRKQLQGLEAEIDAFIDREPYRPFTDFEMEQGQKPVLIQRVHIVEQPDPEWALIVGDIVANFRSALDYLVCVMARENGQEVGHKTAYPLFKDPKKFESAQAGYIGRFPKLAQMLIAGWQPYGGDDRVCEGLSLLADLSNFDKHQAIHVIGSVVQATNTRLVSPRTGESILWTAQSTHFGPFEDGDQVQRFDSTNFPQAFEGGMHVDADFTFQVAFGERGPCAGRPVIDSLNRVQNASVFLTSYFENWFAPGFKRAGVWGEVASADPSP